jgi:hypothetical protein
VQVVDGERRARRHHLQASALCPFPVAVAASALVT